MNDHYTKGKRAASDTDDETWKRGGVTPTLNAMDNTGDTRATVLIAFTGKDYGSDAGELSPTLRAMPHDTSHSNGGGQVAVAILGDVTHSLTNEGHDASEDGTGRGTPIIAFSHTQGLDCQPSELVTPTLRKEGGGGAVSGPAAQVRRLTPVECERLQGFPDNWTDRQADSARYKQMGNAVAVPVVEWIMRRLVAADEETS